MKLFILISLLLTLSYCFYIAATPAVVCLNFNKQNDSIHFKFQVNAQDPQNININIINNYGQFLHSFTQQSGQVTFTSNQFKICFQTTDNTNKAVTIDVWTSSENSIRGLAKKTEYYELHSALRKAADGLREISRMERFQEDRQNIHSELIMKRESSVRVYGIVKMVIIVVLAIGEIIFFKRLFSGKKILEI